MTELAIRDQWVERVLGVEVGGGSLDDPLEALEDLGDIGNADEYAAYLRGRLRQVKTHGPTPFGVVLGRRADAHRMVLQRNKPPKALGATAARQTGLHVMTWGSVEPHPDRPVTLLLRLEGRPVPGLKKRCEQMLKLHRPLPYARVALWADGGEVADLPDPDLNTDDAPPGLAALPEQVEALSRQARAFAEASRAGMPLCEECFGAPPA